MNQAVTILIQALKILNQDMKTPDQRPHAPESGYEEIDSRTGETDSGMALEIRNYLYKSKALPITLNLMQNVRRAFGEFVETCTGSRISVAPGIRF